MARVTAKTNVIVQHLAEEVEEWKDKYRELKWHLEDLELFAQHARKKHKLPAKRCCPQCPSFMTNPEFVDYSVK